MVTLERLGDTCPPETWANKGPPSMLPRRAIKQEEAASEGARSQHKNAWMFYSQRPLPMAIYCIAHVWAATVSHCEP